MTETVKLMDLKTMEEIVKEHAIKRCVRHGMQPSHFDIHLVSRLERGDMNIIPGHPVQISLLWPHCMPIMNAKLDSAFRLIQRKRLHRTFEVVPIAFVQEAKQFHRTKFSDLAEIMDLTPRHRLRMQVETKMTLSDTLTGKSISIARKGKLERFDGDEIGMWIELTRQIGDESNGTE